LTTLSRYLLGRLIRAAAGALVVTGFVLLPQVTYVAVSRLGGVSPGVVLRYLPLHFSEFVPYLLPTALLYSVMGTYARIAFDGEWTAIRMAGIHPLRLLVPVLVVSLPVVLFNGWLMRSVLPRARLAQHEFIRDVAQDVARNLFPGATEFALGNMQVVAVRRTGAHFHELHIRLRSAGEQSSSSLFAETGELSVQDDGALAFDLREVWITDREQISHLGALQVRQPMTSLLSGGHVDRRRAKFLTSAGMKRALREGTLEDARRKKYAFEGHRRDALAMSALGLALLGAASGLLLTGGSMVSWILVASLFVVGYHLFSLYLGESVALAGIAPPWIGAWGGIAILALAGAWQCRRLMRS